jgi:hypothetical protein
MNLVSLLILPAILSMADIDEETRIASPNGASYAVAGVALLVLIGAIAYSKRPAAGLGEPADSAQAAAAAAAAD